MDQIDELMGRLDRSSDLERLRDELAALIVRMVEARGGSLTYWEKVHFEMATALLPTVWLRLCLTHLKMVEEPPAETPRFLSDYERVMHFDRMTAAGLIERVKRSRSA